MSIGVLFMVGFILINTGFIIAGFLIAGFIFGRVYFLIIGGFVEGKSHTKYWSEGFIFIVGSILIFAGFFFIYCGVFHTHRRV